MARATDEQYVRPKDIDNRSTFLQRLVWRLEVIAWDVIYWAPMKALGPDRASSFLGGLVRRLGPLLSQHKTMLRNLRLAFPEKTETERESIASACWENVGRTAGELPHLPSLHPYEGDRVQVIGAEHLDAVETSDKGAVFISGHFANWEIIGAVICRRPVDCLITYRMLNNPHIDRRINRLRHAYGIDVLAPKGMGTRELMRALSAGRCVGLMNDQKFNQGIAVPFFGHDAMTAPGPTRLALKYDVPMVFITTRRTGPAQFEVTVHPPFMPEKTDNQDFDIRTTVARINDMVEAEVRSNPTQWFWQHRRWPKEAWVEADVMAPPKDQPH